MKKILTFFFLISAQIVLFAQNADTYTGVDTTLASYKLGRKIGDWFPFVMLVIIALLFIRHAYRFGDDKKELD